MAAVPLLWSSAWAAPRQKGPNDRITLGFIGTGTQGRGLMQGFLNHSDCQVLAVCDVDSTRREHHRNEVRIDEHKMSVHYRRSEIGKAADQGEGQGEGGAG